MESDFWEKKAKGRKPFICLAPMAGVTDFTFREILAGIENPANLADRPDVMFTEFVSTEMVVRGKKIPPILRFSEKQRPIIA